jgi:anti-sigma factor RsiW
MKKCRLYKKAQRYADGELGEREREAFAEHLSTCRECGEVLEGILALKTVFRDKEKAIPARDVEGMVLARVRESSSGQRRGGNFWYSAGAMSRKLAPAAALFGLVMLILVFASYKEMNSKVTMSPGSYYLQYSLGKHEKNFVNGSSRSAALNLYPAFADNTNNEFKEQQGK